MARKKVDTLPTLLSWDEVDGALRQIIECQCGINAINADLNRQLTAVKEEMDKKARPLQENISALERDVKEFVVRHREDFDGKTKQLNFGKTGFRLSTTLVVPNNKSAEIIESLRQFGMEDCINIKESVDKETLKRYKSEDILKTGAYLKTTDDFWYEVNLEALTASEG